VPWLLDGNNLARGGAREAVRCAALNVARQERVRIVVFFDGAPPAGGSAKEVLGRVEIRYARHADSAIVAFLRGAGRGWRLATDDRALARSAREAGAEVVTAAAFWAKSEAAGPPEPSVTAGTADEEARYFAQPDHRLPRGPGRVPRRRARRGRGVE
jgi:hypothetical protein